MALENERWVARLDDPRYRAFLAGLFRLSLTDDHDPTKSVKESKSSFESKASRYLSYPVRNRADFTL